MRNLYQKNHGLPGLGIKAQQGEKGEKGTGIYFGFINEFFDYNYIELDSSIRVAKQKNLLSYYTGAEKIENELKVIDYDFIDISNGKDITFVYNIPNYNNIYDYGTQKQNNRYVSNIFVKVNYSHITYEYNKNFVESSTGSFDFPKYGVDIIYAIPIDNITYYFYDKNQYMTEKEIGTNPEETLVYNGSTYIRTATKEILLDSSNNFWQDENKNTYYYGKETTENLKNIYNDLTKELAIKKIQHVTDSIESGVKWISNNIIEIAVPTTLKSDFKEGDIIYFYTDENTFSINHQLPYMLVVTKDLIGATYDTIMENITYTDSFNFSHFNILDNSVIFTNNKLTFNRYETVEGEDTSLKESFIKNYNDNLSSDYRLILSEFNNNYKTSFLNFLQDNSTSFFNINYINNKNFSFNSDYTIKFENLYLDNSTIVNSELKAVYNPKNILFNNAGFIYTPTEADFNDDLISIKLNKNNYLNIVNNNSINDYQLGAILINTKDNTVKEIIADENDYINILPDDLTDDLTTFNYTFIPYIFKFNTTKYYGVGCDISMTFENKILQARTIQEHFNISVNDTISETPISYQLDYISAEENDNINFKILVENPDLYEIDDIYINGILFDANTDYNWLTINQTLKTVKEYDFNLSIKNNLPALSDNSDTNSINDIIKDTNAIDRIINNSLISSGERKILVTTKYHEINKEKINLKSNYYIVQPGFKDPRVFPNISLTSKTSQLDLEKSNNLEKGILSNQFQYFIDINFNNLNKETWFKYINDASISITLKNKCDDIELINYNYKLNSLRPSVKMILDEITDENKNIKENYISITNDIITSEIDTSLSDLNIIAKPSKSSYEYYNSTAAALSVISDNIIKNGNKEYFIINKDTQNYFKNPDQRISGVFKETEITLSNLTLNDIQNNNYKLRCFYDFGNPVPTEIYDYWVISNITIEIDSSTKYIFDENNSLLKLTNENYYRNIYNSDAIEFILNPIDYVVAPENHEENIYNIQGSIKLTGSKEQIKLSSGIYNNDKVLSLINNYNVGINSISAEQINWKTFNLKKNFLQDNIQYISIQSKNPCEILNTISSSDNLFKNNNYYQLIDTSNLSIYNPNSYLNVIYNANIMRSKKYNNIYSFYYNDNLYEADRYDQVRTILNYINTNINYKIRTDELLKSIETWNFEYEYASIQNNLNEVYNGYISNYGNGYMYLSSVADTSQYDEDGLLNLQETKDENNVNILNEDIVVNIPNQETENEYAPYYGEYFRTLVYNLKWEYPMFIDSSTIDPYRIISNTDTLRDLLYCQDKEEIETKYVVISTGKIKTGTKDDNTDIIENEEDLITKDLINSPISLINKQLNEKLIPYNLLFSIFPRVLNNTDFDVKNILMLRCPTIQTVDSSILTKRYYNLISE